MRSSGWPASSAISPCGRCAASAVFPSRSWRGGSKRRINERPFRLSSAQATAESAVRAGHLRDTCGDSHLIFMGKELPMPTSIELERRYSAHNYEPLPVVLARGEGAYLWDVDGRRYVDMMSAYSSASHGHGHPRILDALTAQAHRLAVPSRAYYNDRLGPFLAEICNVTGLHAALPMNTGAEAVETAIK